jgi:hypothetical protein
MSHFIKIGCEMFLNIKIWLNEKWLFLLTILFYVILLFTPLVKNIAFIPDYLNLSKLDSKNYFGLIIGAISSVFGILMAVVLLSVEFFKERLSKNTYTNPLDNPLIKNSIYNSVNLIGLSFISYIVIDSFAVSKSLTIGYFIAIIFILYIYSVFPVLKRIIDKSSQIKEILELAVSLKFDDFKEVSKYRYHEKHPEAVLRKLKKEIDTYILENKVTSYENVSNRILNNAINLISDGIDRNQCDIILNALSWLWRENCKTAIRVNDSQYFDLVWNSINAIYLHAAEKKIELLNLYEIESFIYFDIKSLYKQFGNTLSLSNGLDAIENAFNTNITKNCPKQEDIWDLLNLYEGDKTPNTNFSASFTWNHINRLVELIGDIQDIAIELKDTELFEECNERIYTICSHIAFDFDNLGNYQKGYLIWKSLTNSYFKSSSALEKELYNSTLDCFNIHNHLIESFIEKKILQEKDVRIIISTLGDYLFVALKNKKLHIDYDYGTFSDFCRIGINSIKNYNKNDIDKKVVDYFFKYFKYLKKYIESESIDNYKVEYRNLEKAFKHYINVAVNFDGFNENEKPVNKWKKTCAKFGNILGKNDDFGIVKWKID